MTLISLSILSYYLGYSSSVINHYLNYIRPFIRNYHLTCYLNFIVSFMNFFFQYYTIHSTRINSDILYTIGHIIVKRENYGTHSLSKESHVPHKLLTNFGHKFVYLVIRLNNLLFFNYTFVWRSFIHDVCSVRLNNSVVFVASEVLILFLVPDFGELTNKTSAI